MQPYAQDIILAALQVIESGTTPEEIAKNEQLMKCALPFYVCQATIQERRIGIMRVVITTRASLAPIFQPVLEHLVKIMTEVSKNPSNPKFNHYLFESVSALVRCVSRQSFAVGTHLDVAQICWRGEA